MAKNTRIASFIVSDIICFNASYLLAYLIAYTAEGIPASATANDYFSDYLTGFMILIIVKILAMYVFSVYKIILEFGGARDFQRIALALVASTLASVTAAVVIGIESALTIAVILFSFIFDAGFALFVRIVYVRLTAVKKEGDDEQRGQSLRWRYSPQRKTAGRVMIVGKDSAAADLIAEIQANEHLGRKVEIVIDDDKTHEGDTLLGVDVVAGRSEIKLIARRQAIDEIIIAKPTASKRLTAILLRECVKTRCKISMLPKLSGEAANRKTATLSDLRKPVIADLLGRDRPRVDHREIGDHLRGRVVFVTGGAGVFGSELCRRIMRYKPRRLVALDIDEDGLAMLSMELEGSRTSETDFRPVVASVRDAAMMRRAFGAFRPHIVFHAAELKQISLAQTNPREAFLTNVLGLKTTSDLADEFAAEKFILCSTIRAANPTSVAAECKRVAELYIAEKNEKSQTAYTSVRFPNLIEGRSNVIAVFEKQLERGGPLTITDKDIVRRFISAEEAALLTALSSAVAKGGEVFELGPGEAIGIRDLAEAIIRLSGKMQYEEVDIIITELKPGERLFDETEKGGGKTQIPASDRIWLIETPDDFKLPHWSQLWCQDPDNMDDTAVMEILRLIFPTYKTKNIIRGSKIEYE